MHTRDLKQEHKRPHPQKVRKKLIGWCVDWLDVFQKKENTAHS